MLDILFFLITGTDDNLELVETKMPPTDRLKSVLLSTYDKDVIPDGLQYVGIMFKIWTYSFVSKESALKVRAQLDMSWTDPKMSWKPEEFDNVTSFRNLDSE